MVLKRFPASEETVFVVGSWAGEKLTESSLLTAPGALSLIFRQIPGIHCLI